jgi:hypothetical protein
MLGSCSEQPNSKSQSCLMGLSSIVIQIGICAVVARSIPNDPSKLRYKLFHNETAADNMVLNSKRLSNA